MQNLIPVIILLLAASISNVFSEPVADVPLRLDSVENIVKDLETFIPARMQEECVAGLSIAYIRDNRIVWQKGYGLTNRITGSRVHTNTVFSVASLGKTVSAYLALKFAAEKSIMVDQSLYSIDTQKWLPDTDQHRKISLRHLLTHTSGLSNFLRDKKRALKFDPGEKFSYSGVGFMYLQKILERKSGRSFDDLAGEYVFIPTGMHHSWYGQQSEGVSSKTNGHIEMERAVAPFSIVFIPVLIFSTLILFVVRRLWLKRWSVSWKWIGFGAGFSIVATFYFLMIKAGGVVLALYFSICALLFGLLWIFLIEIGRRSLRGLISNDFVRILMTSIWAITSITLLIILFRESHIPLPSWFSNEGNSASSLRSTSGDLARFLIAVSEEYEVEGSAIRQMFLPQVKVNEHVSWGMGVAIQHGKFGDNIWHWGSNPGSKSLMVLYPESKTGIVVLSNSYNGGDLIVEIAGRALGGKAYWDF